MARSLKNMMGVGIGALTGRMINGITFDGLTATGTGQGDALQLTGDVNVVSVVNANAGVVLPPIPQPGDEIIVTNLGANALNVYPSPGGAIHNGGANVPFALASGQSASFIGRPGSVNWIVLASAGSVVVGSTLGTLTFSGSTFTVGTPSSGTIIGATASSTITASGLPTGLTINGSARTWAWDGTGTASSGSFTLTETLAGATNTPHNSTIGYTISAAGGLGGAGTLSAPALGYPSPLASNPATIPIHVGSDWQTGDVLKLARSASVTMSSPTILSHTLTDADIAAGTISIGLSGVTLAGTTYFEALGSHSGVDSANLSNIVTWGDTTAPTITTSATQSITETTPLAVALTGTDTGGIASWSIVSGADQLQFQIVGSTLEWFGNGSQTYSAPLDFGGDNTYNVTVQATDYGGNSSTQAIAVAVTAIDQSPDAFSFTNVNNAALSTQYTSNTITVSGVSPGFNIPSSLSGTGFTYSKNGGAYQAPGSFTVQNGDTVTLRVTSGASNSISETAVLTIGLGINSTASWSVATPGSSATLTTGTSSTGAGANRSRFVNATSFQGIVNNNVGLPCLVRATAPAINTKFQVEITINSFQGGSTSLFAGFDDGTSNFDNTTGDLTVAQEPGNASGGGAKPGFTLELLSGAPNPAYAANGTRANTASGTALAASQVVTLAVDTTAKTIKYILNGTLVDTVTLTSQIPSNWYFFLGGIVGNGTVGSGQSDAATVNFGATAFAFPQSGYTYYA